MIWLLSRKSKAHQWKWSIFLNGASSLLSSHLIPSSSSSKHQGLSKGRPLRRGSAVESWIQLCLSWTHQVCLWSSTTLGSCTWTIDLRRAFSFKMSWIYTCLLSAEGLGSGDLSCVAASGCGIQVICMTFVVAIHRYRPSRSRGWKSIGLLDHGW